MPFLRAFIVVIVCQCCAWVAAGPWPQSSADVDGTDRRTVSESAIPPARTEYLGRTIAQTMHYTGAPWLVRESREREEDCSTMLTQLKLNRRHGGV